MEIKEYVMKQVNLLNEAIDNGDIPMNDKLLHDYKEGVIDICLILNPNMLRAEIGLLVDKIFADVLEIDL